MKNLLSLVLITVFFGTTVLAFSGGQGRRSKQEIQNRFIGAWRLAWLEEPDANGKVHKADCTGLLVYTRDGHMSVQVMYRNPQTGGQAGPVQYAQGGYEASFGSYQIDENSHTFIFHVRLFVQTGLESLCHNPRIRKVRLVALSRYCRFFA